MSAYREQQTTINDEDLLCEALKEVGVKEVQRHKEPVQLTGYHGDKRQDTAEVVIPRKAVGSLSNDIGFKKDAAGNFKAIISDYDRGKYNAKWLTNLKKTYLEKKAMKSARQAGMTLVKRTATKDGGISFLFSKTKI